MTSINPGKRSLHETFGHLAEPSERISDERRAAEIEAALVFERLVELVAPDPVDGTGDLSRLIFALEDLGSVELGHEYLDPTAMPGRWRSSEWYDDAEVAYDTLLYRPDELSFALGVGWEPQVVGDLIWSFARESDRFGGTVPDWLWKQQIADAIFPDPRWGKLVLRVVPKEVAYGFIRRHHSTLGEAKLPPGIMYSLGAFRLWAFARPELVAVATAGQPTGAWKRWLEGRPVPCHRAGVMDLTRVASKGGVTTTDRHGRTVPLNASSMLTARMMDLLPQSGREGQRGCLFTTYSLVSERGTTYLSLVSKGLRPVARIVPKRTPSGARRGGSGAALGHLPKIRWEYGPAALPPDWSVLEGSASAEQLERAARVFEDYERRQRQVASPAERRGSAQPALGLDLFARAGKGRPQR